MADPLFYAYLEVVGSVIALTFAANALVRFQGTRDRMALVLAFGFVLSGLIVTLSSLAFFSQAGNDPGGHLRTPMVWWTGRTLLAVLLVAALVVERRLPWARFPNREIAGVLLIGAVLAYLIGVLHNRAPLHLVVRPGAVFPRPWSLLPAGIFLLAAIGYRKRLEHNPTALDRGVYVASVLNVLSSLLVSQSEHLLDAPFAFAQFLNISSYVVVLGGGLLDNARLFGQVQQLAASDPLTGLANYRRLLDTLDAEIKRTDRTNRPFALLLLDLNGLKKINDRYGHLVGSRALCRLAGVLRVHCRAIDTAARYGGDEFAVVMPETGEAAARKVARRIGEQLAKDPEQPSITVSIGIAVHPEDGATIEELIGASDRDLYAVKGRGRGRTWLPHIAACL